MLGPYGQRSIKKVNSNIFAGKLFCGYCRHALRRYGGLNPKYICQSHRETQSEKCLSDVIYETLLKEVVLAAVKQEVSLAFNAKRQAEKINGLLLGERDKLSGEIKRLSADVLRLKNSRESLFEDYSDGKITKEQYVLMKSEQSEKIELTESEVIRLSDEIYKQRQTTRHSERYERLKPFDKINEVTLEMMSLVDSIYVFDSTRIEIKFSFADGRGQA